MLIQCGEVMTPGPVFHESNEPIRIVARSMADNSVGPMPIVENQGNMKLVGIVTDRDIVIRAVANCRDPKTTKICEIMTPDPITCLASDDIYYALEKMEKCHITRLPIVSTEKKLIGIITLADIANCLHTQALSEKKLEKQLATLKEVDSM